MADPLDVSALHALAGYDARAHEDRRQRDMFAGLAMQALCDHAAVDRIKAGAQRVLDSAPTSADIRVYIAAAAYDMADAMMAERAKRLAVKP